MFDEYEERNSRRRKQERGSRKTPRIKDNIPIPPRISDEVIIDDIFRLRQEIARSNGRFLCTCGTEFPEALSNCPVCNKSI